MTLQGSGFESPARPLTNWINPGKWLSCPVPQFLHLKNGGDEEECPPHWVVYAKVRRVEGGQASNTVLAVNAQRMLVVIIVFSLFFLLSFPSFLFLPSFFSPS